jgi:hypothetical protein
MRIKPNMTQSILAMMFATGAVAIPAGSLMTTALAEQKSTGGAVYVAKLAPLNTSVTGSEASGQAKFTIANNQLTIVVDATGLPPSIAHLQHFHGFADSQKYATCPTAAADTNHDGIIDLIETKPMSGTTMVPFHDDPVSMQIPSNTYPIASAKGAYHYEKRVPLNALEEAFAKSFGGQDLALDRRVVFIHGVVDTTKFPGTVASLGEIPAQVTLPIACGKIEKVQR